LATGLLNVTVGGGGLVGVPAALLLLPLEHPATVLGSVKVGSVAGLLIAVCRYARRSPPAWKVVWQTAVAAVPAGMLGAAVLLAANPGTLRRLVAVVLPIVAIMTFLSLRDLRPGSPRDPRPGVTRGLGAVSGFYEGVLGPGSGTLLVLGYQRFFGWDLVLAGSTAATAILSATAAAAVTLGAASRINLPVAGLLLSGNVIGSLLGSSLLLRRHSILRWLQVVATTLLMARLVLAATR
jgi:uncharacterized membrane protein YfcA